MYVPPDDPRLLRIDLRKELIAAGATDRMLSVALKNGGLARPCRGAYVDGAVWSAMSTEEQYAVRCRAAARQADTGVVLSHSSALPLLDAPLWGLDLSDAHLTRFDGRSGRREAGVRQHGGKLREGDVVNVHGCPVAAPMRAALEVSTIASLESSLIVVNHFLHRGDFTIEQLGNRYCQAVDRWPYTLATGLLLRLADKRIESVGESRTSYFLWRSTLPTPEPQFELYDDGRLVARLDFAFPDHGVWLEFDGRAKYQKYLRPGEDVTDAILREKAREGLVSELTGWRCVRVTWADLASPAALEARIRQVIESVASSRRSIR